MHFADGQPLTRGVGSDPSREGIQAIDAARGAGIDASEPVLDDSRHLVARHALRGRVAGKHGTILGKPVDSQQPATIAGAPQAVLPIDDEIPNRARRNPVRGIEPLEAACPVAHESAVAAEANPDVAGGIFCHRGHIETIERREPVSIRVVMKRPGRSFPARETTGRPLTHCRHPDVTARVFEEPDHDIGSKAVALRVSSCRCRPGQLFEALDATESQNARACADPPVSDAIAQEHLVPAPARRRVRQRELGADDLSPANWKNRQAPPASIPITPRPVARAGSPPMECRPGRRRPWFLRAGSSPHPSRLPPRVSHAGLRPRDNLWLGETQRRAERSEAISPGFGPGQNLHKPERCCRPEPAVSVFEDLIDRCSRRSFAPVHRLAMVARCETGSSVATQAPGSGPDPDTSLAIDEERLDVVPRQAVAHGVVLEPAIPGPAVDPVVRSHPERARRVFGQTPDFGKLEVDGGKRE